MKAPFLLFADSKGKIYTHAFLQMAVFDGKKFRLPTKAKLLPLPQGSTFFYLPQRNPVGFNPYSNTFELLSSYQGKEVSGVSSFLIPAYLRFYHPV